MKKTIYIDLLFEKVQQKTLSVSSAVSEIAVCVQTDYRLFSLEKYDEDIRSLVVLEFMKTGYKIFERYNSEYGSFHNYVISYVKGISLTQAKKQAMSKLKDKVDLMHISDSYSEFEEKHDFILKIERNNNAPYSKDRFLEEENKLSLEEFMRKKNSDSMAKITVILALKACTDLTDVEIKRICNEHMIKEDDFYEKVQILKETLDTRYERRERFLEARNLAFANHRLYDPKIGYYTDNSPSTNSRNMKRYNRNTESWLKNNKTLKRGRFHYSPTNKNIAKLVGICERQVMYYLKKAYELINNDEY